MQKNDKNRLTLQDLLFGVAGSTIFVLALHFLTN